jgi:hypothetical protein
MLERVVIADSVAVLGWRLESARGKLRVDATVFPGCFAELPNAY